MGDIVFIYFPHLFGLNPKNRSMYCTAKVGEPVKQVVDACESSWKWAHVSITVVDGELSKLVLAKARGFRETNKAKYVALVVHGDRIYNQYNIFME